MEQQFHPPQGQITALQRGEDDGVNIVSSTTTNLDATKINQIKISRTQNYNSFQQSITKIDDNTFEITPPNTVLGNWELIPEAETGLVFNGIITAYEITDTGKIRITAINHGLNTGESLQIVDTRDYNGTYTVQKIDDQTFTLDDITWQAGTAVNLKLQSQKRRSIVLNGSGEYISIPEYKGITGKNTRTIEAWIKTTKNNAAIVSWGQGITGQKWFFCVQNSNGQVGAIRAEIAGGYLVGKTVVNDGNWHHVACTFKDDGTANITDVKLYVDGQLETISAQVSCTLNTGIVEDVCIGKDPWDTTRDFQGQIADTSRTESGGTGQKGYMIYIAPDNKVQFWVGNGSNWSNLSGPVVTLNSWIHVTGTYDGRVLRLYVNGVLSGSLTTPYIPNNVHGLRIAAGTTDTSPSFFYNGQIAEVCIWNKARTQAEIQADMRQRLTGKEPNLVAYYPLNKIESGRVLNLVGNNHGTVLGATNITDQTLSLTPVIQGEQFGKVAEVRIWELALNDREIEVNSKTLITGNESGLLAYYPLNESTGTEVRDNSGKGQNGTVSGANWWGCTAAIGYVENPGIPVASSTVIKFDGNDYIATQTSFLSNRSMFTLEGWVKALLLSNNTESLFGQNDVVEFGFSNKKLSVWTAGGGAVTADLLYPANEWHHIALVGDGKNLILYLDGAAIKIGGIATSNYGTSTFPFKIAAGVWDVGNTEPFSGQIAEVRIWNKARTQAEIQADMNKRLTGKETNLIAYYPLNEIKVESGVNRVIDLVAGNNGTVFGAISTQENTLPIKSVGDNALISCEYSSIILDPMTKAKSAIMRRFFAYPVENGVTFLPDKRLETLELKWIGNAQFAPTLLGYIEGPPPVPSENMTLADDYNGATSVELTMTEDVEFNWTRSQDSGLGATIEALAGVGGVVSAGIVAEVETEARAFYAGNLDLTYQFQNESSITSSSSLSMTDKLELRGTFEGDPKFPHLGNRFIPKNIGYALVVSAMADVFVTRLARSGKMVGYQVQPVDGVPPDVNTITFLMNPAYTMNGSLDGMTGSSATSQRFFKHVPEMRSQYGSLYPASYYRLQEAYNLKRQIEAEDKRRESYFSNFNVRSIDEASLNRNIDGGASPTTLNVQMDETQSTTEMTTDQENTSRSEFVDSFQAESKEASKKQSAAAKARQAEIKSKIKDQEQQAHALESFAGWQKKMENIQIKAGKRNIVNTYVWDADGGLRTEAQSFANTVEHTVGGSFSFSAGLGVQAEFSLGADVKLTAQATVNMTQTMSKTETRSKGFELNIDLSGVENKGVTDYKDNPIIPGEKVDRYRFMSFYLESNTQHFQDFFNYVVDPEWLRSNDEEARALRQAQAGKPNKRRVLHRVTYVERPALMGFGRDIRQLKVQDENVGIGKVIVDVEKLQQKVDQILE